MKPIWKQTIRCTAFVLVLVLILVLLSGLFRPRSVHASYDINAYHHSGIYGEPEDSLDTIIIGNSLTYLGLSPIEMWERRGIPSFVCGYAMQHIQKTYENLAYALETQHPQVILMDCDILYWEIDQEDRFRGQLDMLMPIFSFHDMWRKVSKAGLLGKPAPCYLDDAKGYYPIQGVSPCQTEDYMAPTQDREEIPAANRKCLEDIVKLCRSKEIPLVLISIPSPVNCSYAKHNAISDFADQWEIPYRDLNLECEQIGLDWDRHSWDGGDHMNVEGAALLSRYVADWLAQDFQLPDHRGEEAYSQWEISAENYHAWIRREDVDHRRPLIREVES